MTLFVSRRALNTQENSFSNNIAELTRYVSITGKVPKGKWSADVIEVDEFVKKVQAEAGSPDVLIYVHGFATKQKDMLRRHALIEKGLRRFGFKGAVVSFDWPSEGSQSFPAYGRDLNKKAKKISRYLVEDIVFPLLESAWGPKVHMIGHSMGAYIIQKSFAKNAGQGGGAWRAGQILLASGDAHKRDFRAGRRDVKAIGEHCERLTNYYNIEDSVLSIGIAYHKLKLRIGQNGLPDPTEPSLEDVYSTARYLAIKPDFDNDKEAAVFSHGWWFEDDRFLKDAALALRGTPSGSFSTRSVTDKGTAALKR